jgi:hypothetical protein
MPAQRPNGESQKRLDPAEGERRAISGYAGQYGVAASIVLNNLRDDTLEWVRLADPKAGRVDDLQIGSQARVDAYQVKWSAYAGAFTLNDLIKGSGGDPSLIRQLADGWTSLRAQYPGRRVVVHLITNDIPSVNDKVPTDTPPPTPQHFAAFLEQTWKPTRAMPPTGRTYDAGGWGPAWNQVKQATGLSEDGFATFVQDCELEFEYRLPEPDATRGHDRTTLLNDIDSLVQTIFAAVADPARIIQLSRAQLLSRLGWERRLDFRSRHDFWVNDARYQPIERTVRQLDEVLTRLMGGYITLLGSPGSGKSTLLTQTLHGRSERVIRYYAYVPDAQDPVAMRGEAINFLHDMVLALQRAGFHAGDGLIPQDRSALLRRFQDQLRLLHDDWRVHGRKTIILVDGLDHIEREQQPERSLLSDLPAPSAVPEGVFLFLGTQTAQLKGLPPGVQHAMLDRDRRLEMASLSREDVFAILRRLPLGAMLSPEQQERVYALSAGHPLALDYLLNRLEQAEDADAMSAALETTGRFSGNIEEHYFAHWRQFAEDNTLVHLLGLLARLRGPIDLEWIETWADQAALQRLRRQFGHYFRHDTPDRWYFFHNSFRLFLLDKTAEDVPGVKAPRQDRALHRDLAIRCAGAPPSSPWAWEELYHLVQAGEHASVLDRATPHWFRSQLLAYRPVAAILTDVAIGLRSAADQRDPVALARLILVGAEMAQRRFYLEDLPLVPLLLQLGEPQAAVEHVRDGNRLRVSQESALRLCPALLEADLAEEARRLFDLAEPLAVLSAAQPLRHHPHDEQRRLLDAWAATAVDFLQVDGIVATIRRLRQEGDPLTGTSEDEASRALQRQLLYEAGLALLERQRWEDLTRITAAFDQAEAEDLRWRFWLLVEGWRDRLAAGELARGRSFLDGGMQVAATVDLPPEARADLAEGLYRVLGDTEQARSLLRDVPQPALASTHLSSGEGLEPYLPRFRLNRLLYALGEGQSPVEVVPDPKDEYDQPVARLERAICAVAHLWARAWRGEHLNASLVAQEVAPLLRHFQSGPSGYSSGTAFMVWSVRSAFFALVVDAVAQHGPAACSALRDVLEREWAIASNRAIWSPEVRRVLVSRLARFGDLRGWAIAELDALEAEMLAGLGNFERIKECHAQAQVWLAIGDPGRARRQLVNLLKGSFGVGAEDDYQLNDWVRWLEQINGAEPEGAAGRIGWYARTVVALDEPVERSAIRGAASALVRATWRWSSRRAVQIYKWLLDHYVAAHDQVVGSILDAILDQESVPWALMLACLTELVIPVAGEAKPDLARRVVERAAGDGGRDRALAVSRRLVATVETAALPSTRPGWRRGVLAALAGLGIDPQAVGLEPGVETLDQDDDRPHHQLPLDDGSVLTEDEVRRRATSVEAVRTLVERGRPQALSFPWTPVVAALMPRLGRADARALADLMGTSGNAAEILSLLGLHLLQLGDRTGAWALGEKALAASPAYAWYRPFGQSRLMALRSLVTVDSARARPVLYDTLVRDLGDGSVPFPRVAQHLDEILPLLTDELPILQIWLEVERYLVELVGPIPDSIEEPPGLTNPPAPDSPEQALADLLGMHVAHPANEVAECAKRACARCLLDGEVALQTTLGDLLDGTEEQQEHVLVVLDAVSHENPLLIRGWQEQIIALTGSPNFGIRQTSLALCSRNGWTPRQPGARRGRLPAMYQLLLPSSQSSRLSDETFVGVRILPDPDDPLPALRAFDHAYRAIAAAAGLAPEAVLHRGIALMRGLADPDTWSIKGEQRLKAWLGAAELELTYRRPRAILARRALLHIVAELEDAGMLAAAELPRLASLVRFHDPALLLCEPTRRPATVKPIIGERRYAGSPVEATDAWLGEVGEALSQLEWEVGDGRVILAESTTLRDLDWSTPTEERRVHITTGNGSDADDPQRHDVMNRLVAEYPTLVVDDEPIPIVMRHFATRYYSPAANWLALNPRVGRELGWTLANQGLFRWLGQGGRIMVESSWWLDGPVDLSPPHLRDEVGEGWLVLATAAAFAEIKERFPSLSRRLEITRHYQDDRQGRRAKSAAKIATL